MDKPKLTIVVAAYNVSGFIAKCITSATVTQFAEDIEIVVVNDGSTDKTAEVLNGLLNQGIRFKAIHQKNSGLGAARNIGISAAKGDYIWFVDGDDFLTAEGIERTLMALHRHAPDILVLDFSCADENGQSIDWIQSPFRQDYGKKMTGGEFFQSHFPTTYAWLYVCRRDLLVQHNFRFQPRINMQDAEWIPRVLSAAKRVMVANFVAYVYVKRKDSFVNNQDPIVRERYFRSVLEVRRRLIDFLGSLEEPTMKEGLEKKIAAINIILMMAYIYDPATARMLAARLSLLRSEAVFPFDIQGNCGFKKQMLTVAVNMLPVFFPMGYSWVRSRPTIRHMAKLSQRLK